METRKRKIRYKRVIVLALILLVAFNILLSVFLLDDGSTETASTEISELNIQKEKQDSLNNEINPKDKVVALTFDDGPHSVYTNIILDGLKTYNGKATFFVLGSRIKAHPDVLIRTIKEENEVGNHSWDHPQLTKLTRNDHSFTIRKSKKRKQEKREQE